MKSIAPAHNRAQSVSRKAQLIKASDSEKMAAAGSGGFREGGKRGLGEPGENGRRTTKSAMCLYKLQSLLLAVKTDS